MRISSEPSPERRYNRPIMLKKHNGSHFAFTHEGKHFILGLCAGAALLFAGAFAAAWWGSSPTDVEMTAPAS